MSDVLTGQDISKLVHAFYASVRKDAMLAPIFATKINEDHWPAHIEHITNFWSSIFLKTGQFNGNPMRKHLALSGITPAHFERWLSLFDDTAQRLLSPEKASTINEMAQRIGQSLQMGLAFNLDKSGQDNHAFKSFSGISAPAKT